MGILLRHCDIRDGTNAILRSVSFSMKDGERWLVTGLNDSGAGALIGALCGKKEILPSGDGCYENGFGESVALVSLEAAAWLIEEERRRDDSDFVEGGVDVGRTPRAYIAEALGIHGNGAHAGGRGLENHPAVIQCGIARILDRGLKYLSTGEIRRTLLCRALTSATRLIILDDPFDGLDTASRDTLSRLLTDGIPGKEIIVAMDGINGIPDFVSHVLELTKGKVSFAGTAADYRAREPGDSVSAAQADISADLTDARERSRIMLGDEARGLSDTLVEMKNVTVEWSGRKVLDGIDWALRRGEHWLIRGPNGSGKTTLLELITGDNPQVFRNEVWLFGARRGSGETIWDLKKKMGIVSYRLHTEYRFLGDLPLESVILSGLHDSIGLYEQCGEEEKALAVKWLKIAGFTDKGTILFRDLSYGEQRAILIARAAIKQPPLLILDEPCHGLDGVHKARVLDLLQRIAESGTSTLLHVTHDPTEILPCEHHVLELRPGETPMFAILSR